ncbi:DUF1707 SHOCT-like domain-containing protein [Aeromicrobium endophyticum]|uniref:DUF1707 SHOCT-like domain-containing protein n=1 Tax=Aeromicrobium endophyticum TaxID=2292704 RepID=UPI00131428A8|nr:DUF1707 domain-containing protein [Aeromicrobium endophyticum]
MQGRDVWGAFSADPRDATVAGLRASDADRDQAVDVVRDAFVDGRLTRDEFESRRDAVLQARTMGDLLPMLVDLLPSSTPAVPSTAQVVRGGSGGADLHREAQLQYEREVRDARNGWIMITTLCVAIWGATSIAGGFYFFWPVFPSLGVGIGYLMQRFNREKRIDEIEDALVLKRKVLKRRKRDYGSGGPES